jgi:Fe2+ transport system protein FeoA
MQTVTLDTLDVGQAGRVLSVDGPPEIRRRLVEMGLTPGVSVRVARFAPLGDPMDVELRGYHLTLRKNEAKQVTLSKV